MAAIFRRDRLLAHHSTGADLHPVELLGLRWLEFIHEDDLPRIAAFHASGCTEIVYRRHSTEGWLLVSCCRKVFDDGHSVHIFASKPWDGVVDSRLTTFSPLIHA